MYPCSEIHGNQLFLVPSDSMITAGRHNLCVNTIRRNPYTVPDHSRTTDRTRLRRKISRPYRVLYGQRLISVKWKLFNRF